MGTFYFHFVFDLIYTLCVFIYCNIVSLSYTPKKIKKTREALYLVKFVSILMLYGLSVPALYAVKGNFGVCIEIPNHFDWYTSSRQEMFFIVGYAIYLALLFVLPFTACCGSYAFIVIVPAAFYGTIFTIYGLILKFAFIDYQQIAWDILTILELLIAPFILAALADK